MSSEMSSELVPYGFWDKKKRTRAWYEELIKRNERVYTKMHRLTEENDLALDKWTKILREYNAPEEARDWDDEQQQSLCDKKRAMMQPYKNRCAVVEKSMGVMYNRLLEILEDMDKVIM